MSELRACPFCGGAAELLTGGPGNWFACCTACKASTNDVQREHALTLWNRRAPLPVVTREELARLIDPEAFGLPSIVNNLGEDYLTDRDEARAKADAILAFLREKGVIA